MAEILLDGDPVCFEGPVPSSLQDLLVLVEHNLATSGRVLAGVSVDGQSVATGLPDDVYAAARRIDITSLSVCDAIAQLVSASAAKAAVLRGRAAELSATVLREPWGDAAPKLIEVGERLGELLQDLGSLVTIPAWESLGQDFAAGMNRWMDAVAAHDAAGVCLCFEKQILPHLDRLVALAQSKAGEGEP